MEISLSNEVKVPMIGIGTYSLEKEHISAALGCGYRLIDTASQYGNEECVGAAVKESSVARSDIFISTKLWTSDIREHRTRSAFFESMERLQVDYVDMYLIHWPADGFEDAWVEMEKLYNEGYIRTIGVSNFHRGHFEKLEKIQTVKPMVNQIESHPRFHNKELIEYCLDKGIRVEAWSPFGGTGARMLQNEVILKIAHKHKKSSSQIVLRWHIQRGIITLPRSTSRERLLLNLDVFDFELDEEDMLLMESIDTHKRLGADPENFNF